MAALMIGAAFLVGWLEGILINLLADSLPIERQVRGLHCHACGAPRPLGAWSAWVALVLDVRSCEYCGRGQRIRPLIVEVSTALWAIFLYQLEPNMGDFIPHLVVSGIYILILVTDIEYRLIPHNITMPAAVIALIFGILDPAMGWEKALMGGLVGLVVVYLLYLFGGLFVQAAAKLRGQDIEEIAFGFGDVTLAGVIGLTVGWPGVVVALFLGVMAGGLFSMLYIMVAAVRRKYIAFSPIPYGPFLIFGAMVVYIGGREFLMTIWGL